jgi:hypothetical protein
MLLSALIAISIISASFFALFSMFQVTQKQSLRLNASLSGMIINSNLGTYLRNDLSWNNIKNDTSCNSSLVCLKNNTDCTSASQNRREIYCLYSASNSLIYDSRNPSQGFSINGAPCTSFDSSRGNPYCPFRPRIYWKADCASAPCIAPPYDLIVEFEFKGGQGDQYALSASRFNMTFRR